MLAVTIILALATGGGVGGAADRLVAGGKLSARMPVGFFDDPSFRWAQNPGANLARAAAAHASIIHTLANWAAIAPMRPRPH